MKISEGGVYQGYKGNQSFVIESREDVWIRSGEGFKTFILSESVKDINITISDFSLSQGVIDLSRLRGLEYYTYTTNPLVLHLIPMNVFISIPSVITFDLSSFHLLLPPTVSPPPSSSSSSAAVSLLSTHVVIVSMGLLVGLLILVLAFFNWNKIVSLFGGKKTPPKSDQRSRRSTRRSRVTSEIRSPHNPKHLKASFGEEKEENHSVEEKEDEHVESDEDNVEVESYDLEVILPGDENFTCQASDELDSNRSEQSEYYLYFPEQASVQFRDMGLQESPPGLDLEGQTHHQVQATPPPLDFPPHRRLPRLGEAIELLVIGPEEVGPEDEKEFDNFLSTATALPFHREDSRSTNSEERAPPDDEESN